MSSQTDTIFDKKQNQGIKTSDASFSRCQPLTLPILSKLRTSYEHRNQNALQLPQSARRELSCEVFVAGMMRLISVEYV